MTASVVCSTIRSPSDGVGGASACIGFPRRGQGQSLPDAPSGEQKISQSEFRFWAKFAAYRSIPPRRGRGGVSLPCSEPVNYLGTGSGREQKFHRLSGLSHHFAQR